MRRLLVGTRTSNHQGVLYDPTAIRHARSRRATASVSRLRGAHRATERQGRRLRVLQLRREAPCCIPGAAGRNSKEGSWV